MRRVLGLGVAVVLTVALGACAPDGGSSPADVPDGPPLGVEQPAASGVSPECEEAFPELAGQGELADAAHILPEEWPAPPYGVELCAVIVESDESAALMYVSTAQDVYAVLDHYKVTLQELKFAGWAFEADESDADRPSLTVIGPDLAFGIQTDAGTGAYVAGFEVLTT